MHRVVPSTSGWHRASSGGNVAAMVAHNRHSGAQQKYRYHDGSVMWYRCLCYWTCKYKYKHQIHPTLVLGGSVMDKGGISCPAKHAWGVFGARAPLWQDLTSSPELIFHCPPHHQSTVLCCTIYNTVLMFRATPSLHQGSISVGRLETPEVDIGSTSGFSFSHSPQEIWSSWLIWHADVVMMVPMMTLMTLTWWHWWHCWTSW